MPTHIKCPTRVPAVGNLPKTIDEYVGHVNSETDSLSLAHMNAPTGWSEPGQRPEFDEVSYVLDGMLRVTHQDGSFDVTAGQAVLAHRGEWVRYSTPEEGGAQYVSICLPAFSSETVHRDAED